VTEHIALADWPAWSSRTMAEIEAQAETVHPRWLYRLAEHVAKTGDVQRVRLLAVAGTRQEDKLGYRELICSAERGDAARALLFTLVPDDDASRLYAQHVARDLGLVEMEDAAESPLGRFVFDTDKRKKAMYAAKRRLGNGRWFPVFVATVENFDVLMAFHRPEVKRRDR